MMTTKEFIKEIEQLGFEAFNFEYNIHAGIPFEGKIMSVSKSEYGKFRVLTNKFHNINCGEGLGTLFYLFHKYANTPLEDRGE